MVKPVLCLCSSAVVCYERKSVSLLIFLFYGNPVECRMSYVVCRMSNTVNDRTYLKRKTEQNRTEQNRTEQNGIDRAGLDYTRPDWARWVWYYCIVVVGGAVAAILQATSTKCVLQLWLAVLLLRLWIIILASNIEREIFSLVWLAWDGRQFYCILTSTLKTTWWILPNTLFQSKLISPKSGQRDVACSGVWII